MWASPNLYPLLLPSFTLELLVYCSHTYSFTLIKSRELSSESVLHSAKGSVRPVIILTAAWSFGTFWVSFGTTSTLGRNEIKVAIIRNLKIDNIARA